MDYIYEEERIFVEDEGGKVVAEVDFPLTGDGVYTISRTFVDLSLRGQGVAGELVKRAVAEIRSRGASVRATCSYAVKWLEKNGGLGN